MTMRIYVPRDAAAVAWVGDDRGSQSCEVVGNGAIGNREQHASSVFDATTGPTRSVAN